MNSKFSLLLILVASCFIISTLSTPSVYSAGPTKSGDATNYSKARKLKASDFGKIKAPKARVANAAQNQPPATYSTAPGTVCYVPHWTGTGYSWDVAATSGQGPAQAGGSYVGQQSAAQASPVNPAAVCYNVNPCYTWLPSPTQLNYSWNVPATAYAGDPRQASSQEPLQRAVPTSAPLVSPFPAGSYPSNPNAVCYNDCGPYWTGCAACY